jgi:hypothetical protein
MIRLDKQRCRPANVRSMDVAESTEVFLLTIKIHDRVLNNIRNLISIIEKVYLFELNQL